jgi:superoxide dismutase, Fe-Mn family
VVTLGLKKGASAEKGAETYQLPPLPYAYDALEPCIDTRTMQLHHGVHHAGYVDTLNAELAGLPALREASALWVLCNLSQIPREKRVAVHHSAGGHVNHSLFWDTMTPEPTGNPQGLLRDALCRSFGSIETFKTDFEAAGNALFGSGWVWLVAPRGSGTPLEIMTTAGHDHPAMKNLVPVILNDVWEHAYYLRYESRRAEYLKAWWTVVDWAEADHRFANRNQPLRS